MFPLKVCFLLLFVLFALTNSSPVYDDSETAASGHGHGRVQIKVYRGPSDPHEHFAPWGYWVKQPHDDEHHY